MIDNKGIPHLIKSEILPTSAFSLKRVDVKLALETAEGKMFSFKEEDLNKNGVELTFSKPEAAQTASLAIARMMREPVVVEH